MKLRDVVVKLVSAADPAALETALNTWLADSSGGGHSPDAEPAGEIRVVTDGTTWVAVVPYTE